MSVLALDWSEGAAVAGNSSNAAGEGRLTENSPGRIVTGETGLAHTRTGDSQF
jgi:hypothetical protein